MDRRDLTMGTEVRAAGGQISSDLGGEVVILDMKRSAYLGLEGAGARMWTLLQEGRSLRQVQETIVEEFEVDPQTCQRDLLKLVGELAESGLIEIVGGDVGGSGR
jgi:hypothetical protein